MKTTLAAAAAILSLSAASALAQSAGAPAVGATAGAATAAAPMPTPPNMSAANPNTVNPMPDPGPGSAAEKATSAGVTGPEATTGAPAGDVNGSTDTAVQLRRSYPVCTKASQDSCRVSRRMTPPAAR